MSSLPESKYFQYISHLYHDNSNTSWQMYQPDNTWDYPEYDRKRFNRILTDNANLIKDARVLDLGCHTGYMLYVAHCLGAKTLTGVNARTKPVEVGKYFFDQVNVPVDFYCDNIENFELVKTLFDRSDTVILASVLEHLRNPEHLLSLITDSSVKNIILESTIATDDNILPRLSYRVESTAWDFASYYRGAAKSLACVPNRRFLETVLYHHGWKITKMNIEQEFSTNWFATPGLDNAPFYRTYAVLTTERF